MRIDLHVHSTASDGTRPPAEVVARAVDAGCDVVALTDHDTTAGWAEAAAAAQPAGVALVPGAEISCAVDDPARGRLVGLHLLAYWFDPHDAVLQAELAAQRDDRRLRAQRMVEQCRALGAPVTWSQVEALARASTVGRPHIARALADAGVVADPADAFSADWIGDRGRAWVSRRALDPVHAVELVRAAGGVTVLAHMGAARRGPVVGDDVVARLAAAGLDGLEVDHPDHPPAVRDRLRALAGSLGLLVTGASDDHGALTGDRIGCELTDPLVYQALSARAGVAA